MRGTTIKIGDDRFHTGDYGLIQESKVIGNPAVQSYKVEIPGRNGLLNLTKALTGRTCYGNRSIELVYVATGSRAEIFDLFDRINLIHGEVIDLIDDDHPTSFYRGEATVETTMYPTYGKISIVVDAEPFRYANDETIITGTVGSALRITNKGYAVKPTITVSGSTTIEINGKTISLSAGTFSDLDLMIEHGLTIINTSGSGTIKIAYREAVI